MKGIITLIDREIAKFYFDQFKNHNELCDFVLYRSGTVNSLISR